MPCFSLGICNGLTEILLTKSLLGSQCYICLSVYFFASALDLVKSLRNLKASVQIVSPDADLLDLAPHNVGFNFTDVSVDGRVGIF